MPRIEITALLWPQKIDGNRFERRRGDVVDASDADAARLIKVGAAKLTKRKVTVADQKDDEKESGKAVDEEQRTAPEKESGETGPLTGQAVKDKAVEELAGPETETYQDTYKLLPPSEVAIAMPANSAKTELWQDYAIAAGMPETVARGMKRDEIRPLFLQ